MNRLPLVAAQPGIWMAEQLSSLPNAWSVAHYTELKGNIDAPLLAKAIVEGMRQADTLRMRFVQENGEVWQNGSRSGGSRRDCRIGMLRRIP